MSRHPDEAYGGEAMKREEAAEVLAPEAVIIRLRLAVADAGSQSEFARRAGTSKSRVSEALSWAPAASGEPAALGLVSVEHRLRPPGQPIGPARRPFVALRLRPDGPDP